jgi:hypothetical protein
VIGDRSDVIRVLVIIIVLYSLAQEPNVDYGLLVHEVS